MRIPRHPPVDVAGQRLRAGDIVRVVGVPDLTGLGPESQAESRPVFERLVGTYRRIAAFNEHGHAEIRFVFRSGVEAGSHTVWIEPFLLRRKASRPQ